MFESLNTTMDLARFFGVPYKEFCEFWYDELTAYERQEWRATKLY